MSDMFKSINYQGFGVFYHFLPVQKIMSYGFFSQYTNITFQKDNKKMI